MAEILSVDSPLCKSENRMDGIIYENISVGYTDIRANSSTSAPLVATSSIEPFNSSRTSRQLCVRASRHIFFLRAEKRVGNAGPVPDIDEKTEAIEPSSFGFHEPMGVEECVIVRGLDAASRGVDNSDAVRT